MEDLLPWLSLKCVSGIGNLLFKRLIDHFGSPEKVLDAPRAALCMVDGISPRLATAVSQHHPPDWVFREIKRCREKGYHIIVQSDQRYPALLRHIPDPPPLLYCFGRLSGDLCHIAVVGSRKATTYGASCAKRLCQELVSKGISVVSGMARGIDTAAHTGALMGGGNTIAVLGSGLERIYPAANARLFHKIAETGAVVSEFPLDTEPKGRHFPQRNRIISGMSLGAVVVEAESRSGSLITARLAAEQGREVFAVPGSIHAATARGTHDLIKQGAKLVEKADDIIEEVGPHIALNQPPAEHERPPSRAHDPPPLSTTERQVLDAIGPYPVHIDELARRCHSDIGALSATLCQLELKGEIDQEPGKFFIRNNDAAVSD